MFVFFQLDGKLVGVSNLTLEENRKLDIASTATNSKVVNGKEEPLPFGEYFFYL